MPVDFQITVLGVPTTAWLYPPDGEVLERLEWKTDVVPAFNGKEQRVKLRDKPRRSFEFATALQGRNRRMAENLLHNWQPLGWAVPVWMDSQTLASPITGGDSVINVDTQMRDFYQGGLVGVCTAPDVFEVKTIASLTASSVTITGTMAASWPVGALIFPLRAARMPEEVQLSRFTGDAASARLRFECFDHSSWGLPSEPTYRSLPILGTAPNWTQDVEQTFMRRLLVLDPQTGPVFVDEETNGAVLTQLHGWLLTSRTAIDAFRKWLYARAGRYSAFWLPTFALDFIVKATIGSAATTVDVEHAGYTDSIAQAIGRRDIRIELLSGTVYYRRITGAVEIDATTERLSIDSALGASVAPSAIRSVSYMDAVRLQSDAVELAWWTWDKVEVRLVTQGNRNDL